MPILRGKKKEPKYMYPRRGEPGYALVRNVPYGYVICYYRYIGRVLDERSNGGSHVCGESYTMASEDLPTSDPMIQWSRTPFAD